MNISQLKYFVEAVAEGSYTRAARKQCVTTQAISRAVKELENEFNVSLMNREGRAVKPTPVGQLFCSQSELIINECENLKTIAESESKLGSLKGAVSIASCTAELRGDLYTRRIISAIEREGVGIRLQTASGLNTWCIDLLKDGFVDMALIMGEPNDRVDSSYIACIEPKFAVSFEHPLANFGKKTAEQLSGNHIALPLDISCGLSQLDRYLRSAEADVRFESVALSMDDHQRFLEERGVIMVAGEDKTILPGLKRLVMPQTGKTRLRLPLYLCAKRGCNQLLLKTASFILKKHLLTIRKH